MKNKNRVAMLAGLLLVGSIPLGALLAGEPGAEEPSPYMGGPVTLATAPNGAIVNASTLEVTPKIVYTEPTTEKLAEGIWCIGGLSVANTTVIEAPDGLIVYDAGDNKEEGEHILAAIRKISDKPIKVIIYSHSHYVMGAGALVDDPKDVMVIGHPTLNATVEATMKGGGSPTAIPEVGPVMTPRAMVQFNNLMPTEGPDAALQGKIEVGKPTAFLPVTKTVEDGEELDLLGIKFQFFTKYVSDDHNLTVWVPEKHLAMNNFFWPGTPNIYTLRGGVYRDPLIWRNGLKVIRDLQPEILTNTHTRAMSGKDEILKNLTGYMDQLTLTYDQTLRGMLRGLGPDDLRQFVRIPEYLSEIPANAQTYGETVHFPEAIYQYMIGWFDGDVTQIFKVAPKDGARRLVEMMGGEAKVLEAARAAYDKKEFAWGAQLVQYLYLLTPNNKDVRQLKADLLRQMAYRTTGSISRAFLLSNALALEGKVEIPLLIPPTPETVAAAPETFVDYFRVRIDPEKSLDTQRVIQFVFKDKSDKTVGLHVRRGVVEYIPDPAQYYQEAEMILELDSETWAAIYLGTTSMKDAIASGKVKVAKGDAEEASAIFEMFDPLGTS